jgi:hypothetical protein
MKHGQVGKKEELPWPPLYGGEKVGSAWIADMAENHGAQAGSVRLPSAGSYPSARMQEANPTDGPHESARIPGQHAPDRSAHKPVKARARACGLESWAHL